MEHPNNVIEHEGWVVVRNESHMLDIESSPKLEAYQYRYYQTYHEHEHPRNSGFYDMCRVNLNGLVWGHEDPRYYLCDCGEPVHPTVLGALLLIQASDDHAYIR